MAAGDGRRHGAGTGDGHCDLPASKKFIKAEQEAGKASFVLGLCFISEGAFPFAASDPMRVIPACMAGGALTGALSMLFGCELVAPHGGLFVLFIPNAISNVMMYILAIAAGSAVDRCLLRHAQARRGAGQAGDRLRSDVGESKRRPAGRLSYGWQKGGKRQRSQAGCGRIRRFASLALRRAASTLALRPRHRRITSCCWARVSGEASWKRSSRLRRHPCNTLVVQLADPDAGLWSGKISSCSIHDLSHLVTLL